MFKPDLNLAAAKERRSPNWTKMNGSQATSLENESFWIKLREKVNKSARCREKTSGHCRRGQAVGG